MNIDFWTASCTCFILAAVFAVVSAVSRYFGKNNRAWHAFAEGRVVHIETEPADTLANRTEFHDRQYALIEFYAGGHLVKVRGPVSAYPCPYHIGQKLYLCYNPDDPNQYQIVTDRKWQVIAHIAYGVSIGLVAFGCILFLMFAARVEL